MCDATLTPSHLRGSTLNPGAAAETAEANKRRKYACPSQDIFVSFAVETFGQWGSDAKSF